ncbi:MAG: DUF1232 domain-containing protein [Myxococcales bacterium]|nr:MAG: DUF1232 domain-containing protein [Myxococcales bacterium]
MDDLVCVENRHADESDFYRRLRVRVRAWAETKHGKAPAWVDAVLAAPDLFHLLIRLAWDSNVSPLAKTRLWAAIAYFVSPLDLLPELLTGPAGFLDDAALAAYVLNGLVNGIDPELVRRRWAGGEDVLVVIRRVLRTADETLGRGLWMRVRSLLT